MKERILSFVVTMLRVLLAGGLIAGLILVSEYLFSLLYPTYRPLWDARELLVLFVLGTLLASSHHKTFARIAGLLLLLLQGSAFVYFAYFGAFYGPSDIHLLFVEYEDALGSALGDLHRIGPALMLSLGTLALYFLLHGRLWPNLPKSRFSTVTLILLLNAPAIDAYHQDDSQKFEPDSASLGIKNALFAHAFVLGHDLTSRSTAPSTAQPYTPYEVTPHAGPMPYHVILLLGESLTYDHMGAFGYERDTTPHIQGLLLNGQAILRPTISAAVSTRVSVPMLLNVQYEADNMSHITLRETPLFKLAKASGFQTAFISNQKMDGISSALSASHIDYWLERRNMKHYSGLHDEQLVHALQGAPIDWSRPAFIVLNQRAAHSPYASNYPAEWALYSRDKTGSKHMDTVNEYDDSVRFVDQNVADILHTIRNRSSLPVLFVMTSDHGEKLGENGLYGHNTLDFPTARVPFIFHAIGDVDKSLIDEVNALPCPITHYEIGKLLARWLGFRINNPNEQAGIYFLNGTDLMGRAGFLAYRKRDAVDAETCARFGLPLDAEP